MLCHSIRYTITSNSSLPILLLFFFASCQSKKADSSSSNSSLATEQTSTQEIDLADLFQYYTSDPKSQFEQDQNLIVNYIADNNLQVKRESNGLFYVITKEGSGPLLRRGMPVKADYKGYFLDGRTFDSSYDRGKPIRFKIGQMVPGWNQALTLVNRGTSMTLLLPSFLAYGEKGFPDLVPPNSVLLFDIEISEEVN